MNNLNIVYHPHESLTTSIDELVENDPIIRKQFADRLYELMVQHKGLGLSANQIGLNKRLFVMHDSGRNRIDVFNPIIISTSNSKILMLEGCISVPGLYLNLKRPEVITVQYEDIAGEKHIKDLHGLEARCFLHEFDHLSGVMFVDRAGPTKLKMAQKKKYKLLASLKK